MKIENIRNMLIYFGENWKQCIHLVFRTKHFGVNDKWWSSFPSIFGLSWWKIVWMIVTLRPFIENFKQIKIRSRLGFIPPETLKSFGWKIPVHKSDFYKEEN